MKQNTKCLIFIGLVLWVILTIVFYTFIFESVRDFYYAKKLVVAIREENLPEIERILQKSPESVNTYPTTVSKFWQSAFDTRVVYPLNEACYTDNVDLIVFLLENGADPNCNDGFTPLSITYCVKEDHWYQISQILIKYGASLDYITEYSGGYLAVFEDILNGGYTDQSEYTEEIMQAFQYAMEHCDHSKVCWPEVLYHAVIAERVEIIKYLLENHHCDVNVPVYTKTVLMIAAEYHTSEMVQLLLDFGADPNVLSEDGKTAYDYAMEGNKLENAELLKP